MASLRNVTLVLRRSVDDASPPDPNPLSLGPGQQQQRSKVGHAVTVTEDSLRIRIVGKQGESSSTILIGSDPSAGVRLLGSEAGFGVSGGQAMLTVNWATRAVTVRDGDGSRGPKARSAFGTAGYRRGEEAYDELWREPGRGERGRPTYRAVTTGDILVLAAGCPSTQHAVCFSVELDADTQDRFATPQMQVRASSARHRSSRSTRPRRRVDPR